MNKTRQLSSAKDMITHLGFIGYKRQEYLLCLSIDSANRLITRRTVTIGLLDTALAHPREVFAGPLKDRAASVVVAHNHPSGIAEPSKQDIKMTQQLVAAGLLLGIPVRDHIIITRSDFFSFREAGLLEPPL